MTTPHPLALPTCGRRPCVSTQAPRTDPLRRIEPLAFAMDPARVRSVVLDVLGRTPRLRILERDDSSVHAVIRSAWLRVPIDVELRIDAAAGLVHLRVSTPLALRERARPRSLSRDLLARFETAIRAA
jgi:uncharacterized protein (DUF1499 family)